MTMKTKTLLAVAAILLSTLTAQAVPAKPVKKTVRQTDGSLIELTLRGDEHYSFYTDENGRCYQLTSSEQLLSLSVDEVTETWTARKQSNLAKAARRVNATRAPWQAGTPGTTTGKHRGLVLLIEFQDVKFHSKDPKATFNDFFNKEGYSEYGMSGSVRDYFKKQSYGQLEIDFDIVGPYTANASMAYYGGNTDKQKDANVGELILEAIDHAAKDADFSNYDWDNDGWVDQIFIIYAGYAEAQGASAETIWPHESSIAHYERAYNGKKVGIYGCASELKGNGRSATPQLDGIGTACHEFSHCLGLPDMYDTSAAGSNFGMGYWDVMCNGGYNGDSCTPAGYTSYERWFSGWMTPTELKDMTEVKGMKPIATTPEAYVLYNDANPNEYYLLENRQPVDFDAALSGHGLLVLHVDYNSTAWIGNTVNNTAGHERMTIIPANGSLALAPMSGHPYPGTTGNTMLTDYTTPAATLYNENTDGEKLLHKAIDNITESEDGLISFVACRPALAVPQPDDGTELTAEQGVRIQWPAVSDATSYEVQITEVGKAASDPAEALEREFNFEKTVSKTVGFTDISTKMADYGLKGWTGGKLFTTPNKLRIGTSSAAGNVVTPTWDVPGSSEMTIVMGAAPVKAGQTVKGKLRVAFGNQGDRPEYDERSFEVTEDGRLVFNVSVRKNLFYIIIEPETQMYLNYLAIYDGTWTAEQLGIANKARQKAVRKATTVTTHKTETNSIELKNLNPSSRYFYQVRAWGAYGNFSKWSDEKEFSFSTAGIGSVSMESDGDQPVYDLQGRRVGLSKDALRKGIYIIGDKLVVR